MKRRDDPKPYIDKNYKDVLTALEAAGRVKAEPDHKSRKKNTCADHVKFTFPPENKK